MAGTAPEGTGIAGATPEGTGIATGIIAATIIGTTADRNGRFSKRPFFVEADAGGD